MYPIRVQKTFQFEAGSLLHPISEESPAGETLRYEGTYDKIREARTEDDPVLSRGVWKQPMKRADWSDVAALSLDALERRTKDLQIAAWLTESWLHLYGFSGLREGLRVLAGLCETFWDNLHPQAESGDSIEYRVAPIDWINDKLAPVVRLLPITEPASDDVKAYCWDDWESSTRPRPAASPNQGATQAQFQQSVLLTSTAFYLNSLQDVESAAAAAAELESVLRKHCGGEAPSLRQLVNTLESIRGLIVSILSRRDTSLPALAPQPSTAAAANPAPEAPHHDDHQPLSGRPIRNRDEAYKCLAEAADFLAITEPHSPTPYLVRRAIAWGGMRLEDLLPELVRSQDELGQIYRLLQISRTDR
jgi:type VI secretion system ImpA family protein